MQVVATPHECAVVLRPAADELVSEAELLDKPDTALLPREEAVRRGLDDEPVNVLGADLPARQDVALDEHHICLGQDRLEPTRGCQTGDAAPDDDDSHAASAPESHGSARARTSSASVPMNTGSSFSAGGRSSRIPRPSAISAARWSMSKSSSTWSETKPMGIEITSRTPSAASAARCSPTSGPAHGSGVRPADWYAHDQRSSASPARSATSRAVSRHCSSYGSPDASTRCGRLWALKTTWTRVALLFAPAQEPFLDARGERSDEPGGVVVARDVLEVDPAAVELEPVGDLLLVARDGQRAEVRREDEADRVRHAVVDHLADYVLDPRRPVAHTEVAAVRIAEIRRERVDLTLRTQPRSGELPPIAR